MMNARSHRITRKAVRTIALNTGFTSDGELAMILRISAVAAWRVCPSFSSCLRAAAMPRSALAFFATLVAFAALPVFAILDALLRARFGAPLDAARRRGSPFQLPFLLREPSFLGSR